MTTILEVRFDFLCPPVMCFVLFGREERYVGGLLVSTEALLGICIAVLASRLVGERDNLAALTPDGESEQSDPRIERDTPLTGRGSVDTIHGAVQSGDPWPQMLAG